MPEDVNAPTQDSLFGFLAVSKPSGVTSRRVVDAVCHALQEKRVGHAGTLDPIAAGVLVLAIGPATRLIEFAQAAPKSYLATFQLGIASDSHDLETACRPCPSAREPTRNEIEQVARRFVGWIDQVPPDFSAVKFQGRRAYKLARAGRSLALQPRMVRVDQVDICSYDYPDLQLEIRCGRGMYVRSLGRDMAAALGTACVMTKLTRRSVGALQVEDACPYEELDADRIRARLLPPQTFLPDAPVLVCDANQLEDLRRGRSIRSEPTPGLLRLVAMDGNGRLMGVLRPAETAGAWYPAVNFVPYWDARGGIARE